MGVDPAEAQRMQAERPIILYDVENNELENVSEAHPEIVNRLSAELDGLLNQ